MTQLKQGKKGLTLHTNPVQHRQEVLVLGNQLSMVQCCKVGIRRGRNGATEYARRRENAGKRKCRRHGKAEMRKARESGNAEGADMRKAECDRIVGRWMNGRGVTERRTDGRKEGWTDGKKDGQKEGR